MMHLFHFAVLFMLRVVQNARFNHTHHLYNSSIVRPASFHGHPTESCQHGFNVPRAWEAHSRESSGTMLFGTSAAQRIIWQHQHPFDCRSGRFLVFVAFNRGYGHGIGSTIHVIGQYLSIAISLGRILILGDGGIWTSDSFCRDALRLDKCFFEPLSSCSFDDMPAEMPALDTQRNQSQQYLQVTGPTSISDWKAVPVIFHKLLHVSGIPLDGWSYWWRCQSSAFIVRPNARTEYAIAEARRIIFPFRVSPGTISVYVRRGDKANETPGMIASDEPFLHVAESMRQSNAGLSNTIYLGTEDNATVKFFSGNTSWIVLHTNVSRYHERKSPLDHATHIGPSVEFINSLVSLDLSLQCDGFVAAMGSNWGRLINEMRSTVRCKADHPASDPEQPQGMHRVMPYKSR
eukprot:CAMPEP_0119104070 /NCGR_PEP_ID=MMETSP1180-20130426/2381_1 /TAXON_ID=3052 ORGANISM="Chlamydomonas cf sp, Strain CCMP681" /NCGR_SAMPLE_ID=MMETSP1180 /ASSEMBLY_ACC=CAM_ASM_000741 /LENGTH=403 /DNA_ID=CAMNT_0007088739 /DNA_START=140 /DNA_END=1351 /DNA_ORIENTATION=+